jgi:type VI protein secretion system component Hcp
MLVGDGTVVHGGATDPAAPKGSFELSTFGWDAPIPPALGANPKAGAGGATVTNFTITKAVDAASTALLSAQLRGRSFKRAEVVFVLKTSGSVKVVEYDFTKVVVTSYESLHSPSDGRPKESDTFAFSSVQVKNRALNLRGKQGGLYSTGWGFAPSQPIDPPTPTGPVGSSSGRDRVANVHAAQRVEGSHETMVAAVNHHRLAAHKVAGTQISGSRWISAVARSTATEYPGLRVGNT